MSRYIREAVEMGMIKPFDDSQADPLLQFGRCLVNFAVDTDTVYMTTRIDGKKTDFLPFNKGYNNGKGNPPNPSGHKSNYLWQEIFTRESLTNIIEHFAKLVGEKETSPIKKNTLFFPRYHQLEVVRNLLALNRALGSDEDEVQDAILEIMRKRKMRDNASYFAFTATPKNGTLERFGEQTPDGKFKPFHLYFGNTAGSVKTQSRSFTGV